MWKIKVQSAYKGNAEFVEEVEEITKPKMEFKKWHVMSSNKLDAYVPGPHSWLPILITCSSEFYESFLTNSPCSIELVSDKGEEWRLENCWVRSEGYREGKFGIYYRHAQLVQSLGATWN